MNIHKKNKIILFVVVAIIAALCFWAGYASGKKGTASGAAGQFAGQFGGGTFARGANARRGGAGAAGGFTVGNVVSSDSQSVTIQTQDGSSKVILLAPSTQVQKTVPGNLSDVSAGESVMISGQTNGDGSITASSIQIRPESRGAATTTAQTLNQ